jgi:hypothetical protein
MEACDFSSFEDEDPYFKYLRKLWARKNKDEEKDSEPDGNGCGGVAGFFGKLGRVVTTGATGLLHTPQARRGRGAEGAGVLRGSCCCR